MSSTNTPLQAGFWYHIYNRGINRQSLFLDDRNFRYFLSLLKKHVSTVAEIHAYCLLGNHFHLLVRIRDDFSGRPHLGFSHAFNAYAQGINRRYGRTGSLFQRPFRRRLVSNQQYRNHLIYYIHSNPERHRVCADFEHYPYSSYQSIIWHSGDMVERKSLA